MNTIAAASGILLEGTAKDASIEKIKDYIESMPRSTWRTILACYGNDQRLVSFVNELLAAQNPSRPITGNDIGRCIERVPPPSVSVEEHFKRQKHPQFELRRRQLHSMFATIAL